MAFEAARAMRSFNPLALRQARSRSDDTMTRVARALVEAELEEPAPLDPVAAVRFFDSFEPLFQSVPHAATRLLLAHAGHASPAVRRSVAHLLPLVRHMGPDVERTLERLAADPEPPVRSAAAQSLVPFLLTSDDPLDWIERWTRGTPAQKQAMARARRRIPAPLGTAPVRQVSPYRAFLSPKP